MQAWDEGVQFRELISADDVITAALDESAMDQVFDPGYFTRYVDAAFERLGL